MMLLSKITETQVFPIPDSRFPIPDSRYKHKLTKKIAVEILSTASEFNF
ncbi:hypothetical protein BJP36_40190 [Moorena producens JHB]|uniref:Uncharacterized protein n=1 Tax=Moorena producens (strain JHB) TaxID=1454205 RepID=A0A9Q9UV96_MOOP1|nr:hypothetical protein [Moorena producens]WAN68598.1 hypothetical protein BJP36_40190 [Moorena producens JHB]